MDNYQFLRDYQELQHTIMFDRLINLPFGRAGYCEGDRSAFCNYYTSNIGSLKKGRGRGFGKLATEDGTYPHEFYRRIGSEKKFSAACYVK